MKKERRQRVFDNRVLKKIFGHKTDGVTGKYRKLHEVKFHYLNSSRILSWLISKEV